MSTPLAIHRPGDPPAPGKGPGGSLSSLKKKPAVLAAAAAALVVLIALVRKGSGGAADPGTTTGTGTGTGTSTFDSTSNDLYNSIQPEIDKLAQQISDIQNGLPVPPGPPAPVGTPVIVKSGGTSGPGYQPPGLVKAPGKAGIGIVRKPK